MMTVAKAEAGDSVPHLDERYWRAAQSRRVTFDPRFTMGDLLQGLLVVVAMSGVYWKLDSRVSLVEERQTAIERRMEVHNIEQRQDITDFKQDLKEVQRSINGLSVAVTQAAAGNRAAAQANNH